MSSATISSKILSNKQTKPLQRHKSVSAYSLFEGERLELRRGGSPGPATDDPRYGGNKSKEFFKSASPSSDSKNREFYKDNLYVKNVNKRKSSGNSDGGSVDRIKGRDGSVEGNDGKSRVGSTFTR